MDNVNYKYIRIKDSCMIVDILRFGKVRTPITVMLDQTQLSNLFNLHNGPKFIYYLDPKDNTREVRVTVDNLNATNDEIFATAPDPEANAAPAPIVETAAPAPIEEEEVDLGETKVDEIAVDAEAPAPVEEEAAEEAVEEAKEEVVEEKPVEEKKTYTNNNYNGNNKYNKYNNYKK